MGICSSNSKHKEEEEEEKEDPFKIRKWIRKQDSFRLEFNDIEMAYIAKYLGPDAYVRLLNLHAVELEVEDVSSNRRERFRLKRDSANQPIGLERYWFPIFSNSTALDNILIGIYMTRSPPCLHFRELRIEQFRIYRWIKVQDSYSLECSSDHVNYLSECRSDEVSSLREFIIDRNFHDVVKLIAEDIETNERRMLELKRESIRSSQWSFQSDWYEIFGSNRLKEYARVAFYGDSDDRVIRFRVLETHPIKREIWLKEEDSFFWEFSIDGDDMRYIADCLGPELYERLLESNSLEVDVQDLEQSRETTILVLKRESDQHPFAFQSDWHDLCLRKKLKNHSLIGFYMDPTSKILHFRVLIRQWRDWS